MLSANSRLPAEAVAATAILMTPKSGVVTNDDDGKHPTIRLEGLNYLLHFFQRRRSCLQPHFRTGD
jgi:hypothetical protein